VTTFQSSALTADTRQTTFAFASAMYGESPDAAVEPDLVADVGFGGFLRLTS
jgi:hypothetical protein